jgi:hypothetical protein
MGDQPAVLELRVLMRGGWKKDAPALEAFVDGVRLGDGTECDDFTGHWPEQLLGETHPLLPLAPRRVSLLCCGCGEWGCGEIAPLVQVTGGVVTWTDFRLYLAAALDPDLPDDPALGRPLGWPDLTFDVEQYRAELDRATADRSWEPEGMHVADLLLRRLTAEPELLAGSGLELHGVPWMSELDSVCLNLLDQRRLVRLIVPSPGRTPDERVAAALRALASTPPEAWRASFQELMPWDEGYQPKELTSLHWRTEDSLRAHEIRFDDR